MKSVFTVQREIRRRICSRILFQQEPKQTVLIAGASRSGTTWLSDLMNPDNYYRLLFEPFHPRAMGRRGFRSFFHTYHPPGCCDEAMTQYADQVLFGRYRDTWADSHNRTLIERHRLIKTVAIMGSLEWFAARYPAVPILVLFRHPYDVALSRARMGWEIDVHHLITDKKNANILSQKMIAAARDAVDVVERGIWHCCFETWLAQRAAAKAANIHTVFYENLVAHTADEVSRLYQAAGRPATRRVTHCFRQPSLTALSKPAAGTPDEGQEAAHRLYAQHMLELFNMGGLYAAS